MISSTSPSLYTTRYTRARALYAVTRPGKMESFLALLYVPHACNRLSPPCHSTLTRCPGAPSGSASHSDAMLSSDSLSTCRPPAVEVATRDTEPPAGGDDDRAGQDARAAAAPLLLSLPVVSSSSRNRFRTAAMGTPTLALAEGSRARWSATARSALNTGDPLEP